MVVIPDQANLIDYPLELKQLVFSPSLKDEQKSSASEVIYSFSLEIDTIDPLMFLAVMQESHEVSFYWQNIKKDEAIVAIGSAKILNINSNQNTFSFQSNRFEQCQQFISLQKQGINIIKNKIKDVERVI